MRKSVHVFEQKSLEKFLESHLTANMSSWRFVVREYEVLRRSGKL